MYAKQAGLKKVSVQMTYCHLESEEIKQFTQQYMFEELEVWFQDLIAEYEKWARFQIEWRKKRNLSIKALSFPFAYREGQRELAYSVYRTILRRKSYLSKRRPEWERRWQLYFRRSKRWEKVWERRFFI